MMNRKAGKISANVSGCDDAITSPTHYVPEVVW
jgi:hypothetical protein